MPSRELCENEQRRDMALSRSFGFAQDFAWRLRRRQKRLKMAYFVLDCLMKMPYPLPPASGLGNCGSLKISN
jgi:hypothetical protein